MLPLTGRDPLGIQSIWQYRARDVVPALTAGSRRADGFRVLAVALAWWPVFATSHGARATDQAKFFLLFEQAVARACRTAGKDWKLPGTRGLNSNRSGVWMGLDPAKHFLLDSPLANGTWGIYRGPMINAELIDDENQLLAEVSASIRRRTPQIDRLLPHFRKALSNPAASTEIAARSNNQHVETLTGIVAPKLLRKDIHEWFVDGASDLCKGLAAIAPEAGDNGPQWMIKEGIARLQAHEHQRVLKQVWQCERYLATIEAIFEAFCAGSGKRLVQAASDIPVDLSALKNAQDAFIDSGAYEGLAGQRHAEVARAPMTSVADLGVYLVQHHTKVSHQRRSSPWVSINEGGTIACELRIQTPHDRQLDPAEAWRNGYYLDALQSLACDLSHGGG